MKSVKVLRLRYLALFVTVVILFVACDTTTPYHHYEPLSSDGWARTDTLHFQLPPAPSQGMYTLYVGLRWSPQFPYEGFWLVADTQSPFFHTDSLYFHTAQPDGLSTGQGIRLRQSEQPLFRIALQEGQSISVNLRHIMHREVLPALSDVGVRMEKVR